MERVVSDLVRKVAMPVLERAGGVAAIWFIAHGIDDPLVDQTVAALVGAGGLLLDLLVTASFKKWKKRNG